MNPWLLFVAGLALAAAIAWLASRARLHGQFEARVRQAESRAAAAEATVAASRDRYESAEARNKALGERLEAEQKNRVAADASLEAERKNLQQQRRLLEEAEKKLTATFESLSASALRNQSQTFLQLAEGRFNTLKETSQGDLKAREEAIAALLGPLNESLKGYDKQVQEMEKARIRAYGGLQNELGNLVAANEKLQRETGNLTVALKGGSQARGRWGEMTLRRVAELSGMSDDCDFTEQETLFGDSGRLRPDMIVNLPGGRRIAVDAKAPLQAFLDAAAAASEEERRACLARHGQIVRAHLNQLAARAYWEQLNPAPEIVVLFLPGESFFSAALEQDRTLIEDGMEKRVMLATPTTLIALLRAVAFGWRQDQAAKNAREVSELGKQVYDRLRTFTEHFVGVGAGLRRAVEEYNKAAGSFENRVLVSARKFKELGAATGDDLDEAEMVDETPRALDSMWENGDRPTSSVTNKHAAADQAAEDPKKLP